MKYNDSCYAVDCLLVLICIRVCVVSRVLLDKYPLQTSNLWLYEYPQQLLPQSLISMYHWNMSVRLVIYLIQLSAPILPSILFNRCPTCFLFIDDIGIFLVSFYESRQNTWELLQCKLLACCYCSWDVLCIVLCINTYHVLNRWDFADLLVGIIIIDKVLIN